MKLNIKLHKHDLPDDLKLGNTIAVDCEMGGLNIKRDPLCLVQISIYERKKYSSIRWIRSNRS